MMSVTLGLELCLRAPPAIIAGKRLGLLVNQASVDRDFRYAHALLHDRFPQQVVALFGPQHGFFSEQQDNMIETGHVRDPQLGIPIYSLYADKRKPTAAMLDGVDLLVVDLQDVGTRVYTYIWTLTLCMEACAEQGVPVLVLDRPNPLGGAVVEGPVLKETFASFVGRASLPMRHALTIGELARYLNEAMDIGADVHVVTMEGWQREMLWTHTGRPWVPTSPNLPRFSGVQVYPGQVLIEGTQLSEGRGTTTPFEMVGAPFIVPEQLVKRLDAFGHPGLSLRPMRFEPTFQKCVQRSCSGLFLHPTDPDVMRAYRFSLALIAAVCELWPDQFNWLSPPYEYEDKLIPIDMLSGDDQARHAIEAGLNRETLNDISAVDVHAWDQRTASYRLYPGDLRD